MSNVALRRWLLIVAALRLVSVYTGVFDVQKFRGYLFDKQPEKVTDLYGRTFAAWTSMTCILCVICSRNPENPAIYGATLASFVVALVHFGTELLFFKTLTFRKALSPLLVAGISTLWMGLGWNYYTQYPHHD